MVDDKLGSLRGWLEARPRGGEPGEGDLERFLAWALELTGAGYGYLEAGDVQLHLPEPALVTVPEEPWPGVKLPLKSCLGFAAHTAAGPVVFDEFPPRLGDSRGNEVPLGASFVRIGGRWPVELSSPGGFLVAPLPGAGRHACLLLDGLGARFGQETCRAVSTLVELLRQHGAPWPRPDEVLPPRPGGAGELPVLELANRRFPVEHPLTVGQDARCEVTVEDELTSRRHCIVVPLVDRSVMLIDLRSSNGTFVNGEAIETHTLTPGDVIHTRQRKWALVFRQVERAPETSARPPGENRLGYDVTRDAGRGLRAMVSRWAPAGAPGSLRDFCEVAAQQLGLSSLAVLWRREGKLRFAGAHLGPAPAPLGELPASVARLMRTAKSGDGRARVEGTGGVAPLTRVSLGERAFVAWTQRDGSPRPDPALLARILETALQASDAPALRVPDDAALEEFQSRGATCSSGSQCAALVRDAYRAGFPGEAVDLGRSLSARFLDAEEVDAAIQEIRDLVD